MCIIIMSIWQCMKACLYVAVGNYTLSAYAPPSLTHTAGGPMTIQNPRAEVGLGTWTGTMEVKHQSVSRVDSVEMTTTTFANQP